MALKTELNITGNWLFRWRSYLPLILLAIIGISIVLHDRPIANGLIATWELGCMLLAFVGFGIRVYTVGYVPAGTSGRNTRRQIADQLNTTGFYSVVRHPLYFGNLLIYTGIALFPGLWWMALISLLAFQIYYERIMYAEEEFLEKRFGDAFRVWAEVTPAIFPRLGGWKKPSLRFSLRNVLKREYSGLFAIIASFSLLKALSNYQTYGHTGLSTPWWLFLFAGLASYFGLMILKKKTRLLQVSDR